MKNHEVPGYPFVIKSSATNDDIIIEGYASVYNIVDKTNDIIRKGAFVSAINRSIKLLWQHDQCKPIGTIKSLVEDDYGLKMVAVINSKISTGREAIELVKQQVIDGLSIGFFIKSFDQNNLGQRIITETELIEISIVTFPANTQAQISKIKETYTKGEFMDKTFIIKDIEHSFSKENKLQANLEVKMGKLEDTVSKLQNFLARPDYPATSAYSEKAYNINSSENQEYKAAFSDYLRKGVVNELVTKAFSSDEETGGVLIAQTLYSKIIHEMTALSPMRQLASIETISTNALDIVIEGEQFASGWIGEAEARVDTGTPKLIKKKIPVHELYAQPKATQRLVDDSALQFEQWLSERLRDSFIKGENEAFLLGDGNNKPTGLLHNTENIQKIETGDEVTVELLLDMISALNEEYLANATFLMNRTTLAAVQKLTDNNDRLIWQPSLSDSLKQSIFGIPVVCASHMPNIANDAFAIALGDFKAAYKIVDRVGINVMRDPYTDKPFIKYYAVKRVGGDLVNPNAVKLAQFKVEADE